MKGTNLKLPETCLMLTETKRVRLILSQHCVKVVLNWVLFTSITAAFPSQNCTLKEKPSEKSSTVGLTSDTF